VRVGVLAIFSLAAAGCALLVSLDDLGDGSVDAAEGGSDVVSFDDAADVVDADAGAAPVVLANNRAAPHDLQLDPPYVVWIEDPPPVSLVVRYDTTSQLTPKVEATSLAGEIYRGLAADATKHQLFWTRTGAVNALVECRTALCNAQDIAQADGGQLAKVIIEPGTTYWEHAAGICAVHIYATDRDSGATAVFHDACEYNTIASDGTSLWYESFIGTLAGSSFASDASVTTKLPGTIAASTIHGEWYLFGTGAVDGSVYACALPTCPDAALATGQAAPIAFAADDNAIYWINAGSGAGNDGSLVTCAATGPCTPNVLVSGIDHPTSIAIDATYIYYTDASNILRLAR